MLTQRIQQADPWLNPQLTRMAVDVQSDRPGRVQTLFRRRDNVAIHQAPSYASGPFTWRMST